MSRVVSNNLSVDERYRLGTLITTDEDGNYVLEMWGASTKHPDVTFNMKDYEMSPLLDRKNASDIDYAVFQWVLECAGKMLLRSSAIQLVNYALENWADA